MRRKATNRPHRREKRERRERDIGRIDAPGDRAFTRSAAAPLTPPASKGPSTATPAKGTLGGSLGGVGSGELGYPPAAEGQT